MSGPEQHDHLNPDYYAETASLYSPADGQHHGQHQAAQQSASAPHPPPPPKYQQHMNNYYPPPPGPPASVNLENAPPKPPRPAEQQQQQQQQQYYAPPSSSDQTYAPPPSASEQSNSGAGTSSSSSSKPSFTERLYQWSTKAGVPINKVTNKLGSEAFWPSTMDIECDKAARILKSFCKDGFYTTEQNAAAATPTAPGEKPPSSPGPKSKPKVLVKIPQKAIQTAAGLAIFTTFRTGLHFSGAGGSGLLVSRLPDGSWSPPSGFLVHTLGAGLMIGLDIYDCVCVLRTPEAVAAFTRPRLSLGGEIGLVAGPVGAGAAVEAALAKNTKPIWSYMKSRGFYAGVQADGTIIIARPDANAAFYGLKGIKVDDILKGNVPARGPEGMWPTGARQLIEVLKSAEGRRDVDEGVLKDVSSGPTPGDLGLGEQGHEKEVHAPHDRKYA